jgi:hypothetical protein
MTPLLLVLAALAAAPSPAQVVAVRRDAFRLAVGRCFDREFVYPDHDRVDPHLPKTVCVTEVTGTLAYGADGAVLGAGSTARAAGTETFGATRPLDGDAPLKVEKTARGYTAVVQVESTPEDPAGDSGRILLAFDLDRGGIAVPGSVRLMGLVECTFAPVCTDGDLQIPYEDAGGR